MNVPAAARTMAVFETFASEQRELGNSELSRLLEVPESSCSDLLRSLVACGYLSRVPGSRRLYPTAKLATVAQAVRRTDLVEQVLRERTEALRDRTSETALSARIDGSFARVIACCEGRFPLRYTSGAGERISLHVSALGKAMLALQPPAEAERALRAAPLRKLGPATITDPRKLVEQLRLFALDGHAYVENEGGDDLAALAVAGYVGGVAYALSVAGPVGRVRLRFRQYLSGLKAVAKETFDAVPRGARR